jgi:poly-gamma-glutamate synthesis protein (capsule biosynthesis protein)
MDLDKEQNGLTSETGQTVSPTPPEEVKDTAVTTVNPGVASAISDGITTSQEPAKSQVTLLAVGDNLIHSQVIRSGKQADGTYNYDHLYSNLKELISAADIAVINQETILGGDEFPYSGYPNFNSPTQIGDAVIKAGFDVVLHATNHTMDKGLEGVKNDINYWKLHPEITVLGINETEKEREQIPIIDKNGIKIKGAILGASTQSILKLKSESNIIRVDIIDVDFDF